MTIAEHLCEKFKAAAGDEEAVLKLVEHVGELGIYEHDKGIYQVVTFQDLSELILTEDPSNFIPSRELHEMCKKFGNTLAQYDETGNMPYLQYVYSQFEAMMAKRLENLNEMLLLYGATEGTIH